MTSTSPSSAAASWAPLLAASKKPLPSDLTTSAMRVWAKAGLANSAASAVVIARVLSSFIGDPSLGRLVLVGSGDGLTIALGAGLRHDEPHACRFEHLAVFVAYAAVGDDGG